MSKKLTTQLIVVLSVAMLSACSILPERQNLVVQYYGLPLSFDSASARTQAVDTLMMARPLASKAYATQQMAFRHDAAEVSYYAESRWVDEPAQLLADALQSALEQERLFAAVIPQGTPVTAQWRLELELLSFIQDYSESSPNFDVQLRVRLVDVVSRKIAATRVFSVREPISNLNAEGGVNAALSANAKLIAEVVAFISRAIEAATN